MVSVELVRSPNVWFQDGTVVLQAGVTLFRVYRGVLAAQSSIFSDMFAIPQPSTQELYDGVPLEVLAESPHDLQIFLVALHDASYFGKLDSFPEISALLRLGTKYDVQHFRIRMVTVLTTIYPSTLSEWLARQPPPTYESPGVDFLALDLACTLDILPALPGIYYECCRHSLSFLLNATTSKPFSLATLIGPRWTCATGVRKRVQRFSPGRELLYGRNFPVCSVCHLGRSS